MLAALMLASTTARADERDPFDGGTVGVQAALGTLTGAVGGAGLGFVGAGAGYLLNPKRFETALFGGFLGFVTGAAIGVTLGVHYGGDTAGANGSYLGTGLGVVGGAATFATFELVLAKLDKNPPSAAHVLAAIASVVGGAIIGYHLSADDNGGRNKLAFGFAF